jgi:hypothetical protein
VEYVSTAKWRERRWRPFSTLPYGKFGEDGDRGMIDSPETRGVGVLDIVVNILL